MSFLLRKYRRSTLLFAVVFSSLIVISMWLTSNHCRGRKGCLLGPVEERRIVGATIVEKEDIRREQKKAKDLEHEGNNVLTVGSETVAKPVIQGEEKETKVGTATVQKPVIRPEQKRGSEYERNNLLIHNCEDKSAVIHSEPKLRKIDFERQRNGTSLSAMEKGIECTTVHLNTTKSVAVRLMFPLCLFNPGKDSISRLALQNKVFERQNLIYLAQKLLDLKDVAFIDIGANIGLYTLMAASLNIPVLAIEPKAENIMRIRKALSKLPNHNVSIFQNAVSDTRTSMKLMTHSREQGRTIVVCDDLCKNAPNGDVCTSDSVDTIHMDDLLSVFKFKKAVMKIDIEGHEIHAFVHSDQLFRDVDIRIILMEWDWRKRFQSRGESDRKKVEEFIAMLKDRGFTPQDHIGKPLSSAEWDKWPVDVFFVK